MISRKNDAPTIPDFFDILATLSIEEQRATLEWLREIGGELGCTIANEDIFVSKDFLDFLPGLQVPRTLN